MKEKCNGVMRKLRFCGKDGFERGREIDMLVLFGRMGGFVAFRSKCKIYAVIYYSTYFCINASKHTQFFILLTFN
jgi:hypothetical protein